MQSGSWVGFTKTQKGKKYHATFSSGKQAQQWAIKNNGGAMPKSEWDSKEAKYAVKEAELTAGQKKLDVDGDGDIEGDDLADLRAGKKANESRKK